MRRVIITVLAVCLTAIAAAPPLIIPPTANATVEIDWTAAPTVQDIGVAETIWLEHILFATGATGRTVTIATRATVPITVFNAVPLAANQVTALVLGPNGGARMLNGFTIVVNGTGVVYQFRGRVRR